MNILYIEDIRRPERNCENKKIINKLGFSNIISYYDKIEPSYFQSIELDGVICHSGMAGYEVVNHFAKEKGWPFLSYTGSVNSSPFLKEVKFSKNHYSVDSEFFEVALPQFVDICQAIKAEK